MMRQIKKRRIVELVSLLKAALQITLGLLALIQLLAKDAQKIDGG